MNVTALLSKSARAYPQRTAVRCGSQSWTYAQLDEDVARIATWFECKGVSRGERVAIVSRNRPEYVVTLFGAWRAGLIVVPINARLHRDEVGFILRDTEATAVVYDAEQTQTIESLASDVPSTIFVPFDEGDRESLWEMLDRAADPASRVCGAEEPPPDGDATAWLFYTSGTTGRPKGAMLTHRNLTRMVVSCLADVCSFSPEDVVLHIAPLSHGSGLYLLPSLARGAENVFLETPHLNGELLLETIERKQVTVIPSMSPTVIAMLLETPSDRDTSSLRRIVYGGAPAHVEHLQKALERFGPVFVQIYGQGEAPMTISYLRPDDHRPERPEVLASAGIPFTDVEVGIVDSDGVPLPPGAAGEIVVRGEVVMRGYWRNEAATADAIRDGWLYTGDLGKIGDSDGRIYLLDRKKDTVITGGLNVYPREVEDILVQHAGVREAVVFGVPDPYWGEKLVAAVVPRASWRPNAEELISFCQERIASFKKPRHVEFLPELPKNAYGKVLRRELKATYAALLTGTHEQLETSVGKERGRG